MGARSLIVLSASLHGARNFCPNAATRLSITPHFKQIRAVLAVELAILACLFVFAFIFWHQLCSNSLDSCLVEDGSPRVITFLVLSAIRPFVFTPLAFIAILSGKAFGPWLGTLLTAVGSLLSCLSVFGIGKLLGKRYTKPWLSTNLPATFKFIRSQDYKIVFAARLLPVMPFDILSFLFGAFDLRFRSVAIASLIGVLPEAYLYAKLVDPAQSVLGSTVTLLELIAVSIIIPLVIFEFISRKNGSGMWQRLKAVLAEIRFEARTNNDIVKRRVFDPNQTPVLLLYGFFSSRRTMTQLESHLTSRGHQVMSFNLGGLLGTFFTADIIETANFIDYKIKRQFERHGFKKIHIVAHSKGGLVALWWALKLGGNRYCDKIITMGTPFEGTWLTYLALVTPLGFLWRDVGQMRPGSAFLSDLRNAEMPSNLNIYCVHSQRDQIAKGRGGVFQPMSSSPQVTGVPMHDIGHFEMLYRPEIADKVTDLLHTGESEATAAAAACQ